MTRVGRLADVWPGAKKDLAPCKRIGHHIFMTNPASPNHVVENRCVPAVYSAFGITDAKS